MIESSGESWLRRAGPALTLVVLSPVIAELLSGSTRISTAFVLIPEMGVWGCGPLLIRYVTRTHGKPWYTLLTLGLALAVAEEFVIQQTSLAPLIGVSASHQYARAFGVNWLYLLWALGYESVWVVVIPVMLTEMIFPARRGEPWIGKRGVSLASICFVVGAFAAWYSWTRIALPVVYHGTPYEPSAYTILAGLLAMGLLILVAFKVNMPRRTESNAPRLSPRPVGVAAFLLSLAWSGLLFVAYGVVPELPPLIPIAGGIALAIATFSIIRRWSGSKGWRRMHNLALVFGGMEGSMVMGIVILITDGALLTDLLGDAILNAVAFALLLRLVRNIRRSEAISIQQRP